MALEEDHMVRTENSMTMTPTARLLCSIMGFALVVAASIFTLLVAPATFGTPSYYGAGLGYFFGLITGMSFVMLIVGIGWWLRQDGAK
jgi:hypothetical protein